MSDTHTMELEDVQHDGGTTLRRVTVLILRWLIGSILLATAIGKALDVPGFAEVVGTYQVFPPVLWLPVAISMVVIEGILAVALLHGRHTKRAGLASTALHSVFTLWAAAALLRGLEIPNCGCFGVFLGRPLTWGTVGEDAFMVGVSGLLWWLAPVAVKTMTSVIGEQSTDDSRPSRRVDT